MGSAVIKPNSMVALLLLALVGSILSNPDPLVGSKGIPDDDLHIHLHGTGNIAAGDDHGTDYAARSRISNAKAEALRSGSRRGIRNWLRSDIRFSRLRSQRGNDYEERKYDDYMSW